MFLATRRPSSSSSSSSPLASHHKSPILASSPSSTSFSSSSPSLRFSPLLISSICTFLVLLNGCGGASAYYSQHFYLPTGYNFGQNLFEPATNGGRQIGQQQQQKGPLAPSAFFLEQQPKIVMIDGGEEEEGTAAGNDEIGTPASAAAAAEGMRRKAQQQQLASKNGFQFKMVQRQRFTGNSGENQAIPRRQMRHLLADEFGTGRMGRQYKRMRPCFYSPIQCLMRRRRTSEDQ